MNKDDIIYVAGHNGLVGSAIMRKLENNDFTSVIYRTHSELDLRDSIAVNEFIQKERPTYVIMAAGKVGGICANINNPAEFLYDNVIMQSNIIHQSYLGGVKKMLVLGSSCIYPKECPQPMKEEYLMNGKLEPTNEGYALSKIIALKMGEYYKKQYGFNVISVMPCNLYGYNDSFDLNNSHVLSATVKKFVDALDDKSCDVVMWGTGEARREFMNVEDMADACLFMLDKYEDSQFINVGCGYDISIRELAELVAKHTGFMGTIKWNTSKPDGMKRKCLDVSRMRSMGFEPKVSIEQGVIEMIRYYKSLKK